MKEKKKEKNKTEDLKEGISAGKDDTLVLDEEKKNCKRKSDTVLADIISKKSKKESIIPFNPESTIYNMSLLTEDSFESKDSYILFNQNFGIAQLIHYYGKQQESVSAKFHWAGNHLQLVKKYETEVFSYLEKNPYFNANNISSLATLLTKKELGLKGTKLELQEDRAIDCFTKFSHLLETWRSNCLYRLLRYPVKAVASVFRINSSDSIDEDLLQLTTLKIYKILKSVDNPLISSFSPKPCDQMHEYILSFLFYEEKDHQLYLENSIIARNNVPKDLKDKLELLESTERMIEIKKEKNYGEIESNNSQAEVLSQG